MRYPGPERRLAGAAAALLALAVGAPPAAAWGPEGHRRIGEKAIESLRDPLKEFFEDREEDFFEFLEDPGRGRNPAHFHLESYDVFPFWDVPANRELAGRRFSEEEIEGNGDALFRLLETWAELVETFRESDFEEVLGLAADVSWLVGEVSTPPNISAAGDGQPTEQDGLARRFDTQLLETFANQLRVDDSAGLYLDRPEEYMRSLPVKAHVWVDNITFVDSMSRRGIAEYDRFYMESMWRELGPLVNSLLTDAAGDAASLWYTAWVAAGRPEVPET